MIETVLTVIVSSIAGGAAAWATLQARVRRLEEMVTELKVDKASKESLDSLRSSVERLREDMDRRFDRLEAVIIKSKV